MIFYAKNDNLVSFYFTHIFNLKKTQNFDIIFLTELKGLKFMAFIEQNFLITISDVSPNFLLTNKALLGFCEKIACAHSDTAGYGANDIERTRLTWILLAWKVEIFVRPRLGDQLKIVTWARDTGKISTHRDFEIYLNNELIALASSKWALINVDKGLTKIDSIIVDNYHPEEKAVFGGELKRLREVDGEDRSIIYPVYRHDIDVNRHVHNLNYLDYAMEIVDEKDFLNQPNKFEITYKQEAKLGDTLKISYSKADDGIYVTIKNQENKLCSIIKFN